uniref:Uncharacterized protein n=1 Tax=Chromera velia CCMP2878 TaxID=1169474 RepID=A0A0G4IAA4_9ALVE|eukprot:Cvel_12410.t1-p1 / transcript=Cvel_12410.t1 / gene=Cvel_12410 / organism=Chromera_velia_CCMP2878 / gene_product=hypothetical protein / transcript_product=hypothetical protein / location=Cvel_scaffold811:62235-66367(+) / protein_length=563 / sequence_SO=supercontig / SO=protein_coding / is_pseudo=false
MIDILKDYVEGVQANANPTEFVGQGGTLRTLPLENSADLLADGKGEGSGAKRADGLPEIRETEFRRIKDCLNARASLETALRATQDRLIVATAKLHDYRRRSNRLEKELNSMTKTAGNARTELEEARAAADMWEKRGKEATGELYSQREAHMTEVKLLQRSLRTKLDDPRLRGRTDEATELAERLAKALLQRDETAKDNVKLKAQVIQVKDNIKGLQQELSMEQRHKKKVLAQTTMLRQRLALANTQDARGLAKHDERALDILKKRGKHKEDSEGGGTEGGGAAGSSLPPLVSASASGGSGTIKGPRKIPSDAAPAPLDPAYLAALAIREREEVRRVVFGYGWEESDEDFSNSLRATEQRLAAAASNAEGLHELIAEHEKQRQENLRQIADGRVVEEELRAALAQWREICESKESAVVRLAEIVRCLQDHRRSIVEALGVDEGTLAQLGLSEPEIDPPVESLALPGPDGTGGGDPQIHASTRPYDGTNRMDGAYRGPLSLFTGRQAESSDKSSNFRALYAEIQQLKTARDHHLQTAEGYQKVNLKLQVRLSVCVFQVTNWLLG